MSLLLLVSNAVRAANSLEVPPRCDAVVDKSFPFVHSPRQLADMPPPDTCIAPNPELVRPLVTIVRGMPLRGHFWAFKAQEMHGHTTRPEQNGQLVALRLLLPLWSFIRTVHLWACLHLGGALLRSWHTQTACSYCRG